MARRPSGKRSVKRAFKKRHTQKRKLKMNRRKTQRGGLPVLGLGNIKEMGASVLRDKVDTFRATVSTVANNAMASADVYKLLTSMLKNVVNIIPIIIRGVFNLMVMCYILSMFARNPKEFANVFKEQLQGKYDKLKTDNPNLTDLLSRIETKFKSGTVTVQEPPTPPPTSNVGKAVIYYNGSIGYQGLIVGESGPNEDYGQSMYYLWLKGGGMSMPKPVKKEQNPEFKIIDDETSAEFMSISGNKYGQQRETINQAREFYGVRKPGPDKPTAVPPAAPPTEPQEQSLYDRLKEQIEMFKAASDKTQFIKDAINGYIEGSKIKIERLIERISDSDLRDDITRFKDAILSTIRATNWAQKIGT